MGEHKDVKIEAGIGSIEAVGLPSIKIITEKNFWEWNWLMLCLTLLANIISLLAGALINHFVSSCLGVGLGIGLPLLCSIMSFYFGIRAVVKRTIKEIYS